ncbi:MAG: response regulator transcription factor [Elusimicrobia bacterium]|nr:response regulator transcription factor [Elusimicrobiota bacterium]
MKPRALVVEDDRATAELLRESLTAEGFGVVIAAGADDALQKLAEATPALILLDIGLPGFSGLHLCRHIKQDRRTARVPVVMVTSLGAELDKVRGLDAGADDYIVKPFSAREFRARIRALMRRAVQGGEPEDVLEFKDIILNNSTRTVQVSGKEVALQPKEFQLLALLLNSRGRVLTRQVILEAVWGPTSIATNHTINVCVANLRKKLGPPGRFISPVTGLGYRLLQE